VVNANNALIKEWGTGGRGGYDNYPINHALEKGEHPVRIDYYEHEGDARVSFDYETIGTLETSLRLLGGEEGDFYEPGKDVEITLHSTFPDAQTIYFNFGKEDMTSQVRVATCEFREIEGSTRYSPCRTSFTIPTAITPGGGSRSLSVIPGTYQVCATLSYGEPSKLVKDCVDFNIGLEPLITEEASTTENVCSQCGIDDNDCIENDCTILGNNCEFERVYDGFLNTWLGTCTDSESIPPAQTPTCAPLTYPTGRWERFWLDTSDTSDTSDNVDDCLGEYSGERVELSNANPRFDQPWGDGNLAYDEDNKLRFTSGRTINFPKSGLYRFTVGADDGVRMWIDNVVNANNALIKEWGTGGRGGYDNYPI
ncbi:MAG: hypothetical protein QF704_15455, partial [Anaerolineales bacterium]|nr:hypothetical protein [Anaerolineales bacterium]